VHISSFRVQNFRRLKDCRVNLDVDRTIFVGANNSGKTSATHLFRRFLGRSGRGGFRVYDFSADCWDAFDAFDTATGDPADLPRITFDLWFHVEPDDVHRALPLLPGLDWDGEPVGVRMELAPRDGTSLVANFVAARDAAVAAAKQVTHTGGDATYGPWPTSMVDYLTRQLMDEYEIFYFVLDAKHCTDLVPDPGYDPFPLGTRGSGAGKVLESIIRVDFLDAQRHLADAESHGRGEDLSRRLSRFYDRNLPKPNDDIVALGALADAEARLSIHFDQVFGSVLSSLGTVGYPGIANPELKVQAAFDIKGILDSSAEVHYQVAGHASTATTLPDQYNGLGFKNLIYMVVEVLDFHETWKATEEDRAPVHLVVVEEPEAHLHAPLQQVFTRKIREVLGDPELGFATQFVVTTHSPHIVYESSFTPIRYFCRWTTDSGLHLSKVKDLSQFDPDGGDETLRFLRRYIKLTHCDLFFADAAVLVEGNVERLLLPLVIERFVAPLTSNHLTILEVGGAFAHMFMGLVEFLGIPTLVITDLDSVAVAAGATRASAHMTDTPGASTTNAMLKDWVPKLSDVAALLAAADEQKVLARDDGSPGLVRVAYQTRVSVTWGGATDERAGRTLEEAFALENLAWTQSDEGNGLGLKIEGAAGLSLAELHRRIFETVRDLGKSDFALHVIATDHEWTAPHYITDGLEWLRDTLAAVAPETAGKVADVGETAENGVAGADGA
jgi:predicted ATP-dependent endonuclease of OLD family